jgi:poly(A) polymerase Pap1
MRPCLLSPCPFFLGTSAGAQQGTRKLDISYPTNEFTKLVKLWDNYDAETMGVIVRYIKRWADLSLGSKEREGCGALTQGRVA